MSDLRPHRLPAAEGPRRHECLESWFSPYFLAPLTTRAFLISLSRPLCGPSRPLSATFAHAHAHAHARRLHATAQPAQAPPCTTIKNDMHLKKASLTCFQVGLPNPPGPPLRLPTHRHPALQSHRLRNFRAAGCSSAERGAALVPSGHELCVHDARVLQCRRELREGRRVEVRAFWSPARFLRSVIGPSHGE